VLIKELFWQRPGFTEKNVVFIKHSALFFSQEYGKKRLPKLPRSSKSPHQKARRLAKITTNREIAKHPYLKKSGCWRAVSFAFNAGRCCGP